MALVLRPLVQWPWWRHRQSAAYCSFSLHSSSRHFCTYLSFSSFFSTSHRSVHFRSRANKLREVPFPDKEEESGDTSSSDEDTVKKSRNQKKRDARRAVRWGMELASFSPPQIKRIIGVTALEGEVFDELMLVKKFGRDVKEGKRRQFNYIGRLIREADPELMDGLIHAIKSGDQSKFQELSGTEILYNDVEEEEDEHVEDVDEVEDDEFKTLQICSFSCYVFDLF